MHPHLCLSSPYAYVLTAPQVFPSNPSMISVDVSIRTGGIIHLGEAASGSHREDFHARAWLSNTNLAAVYIGHKTALRRSRRRLFVEVRQLMEPL